MKKTVLQFSRGKNQHTRKVGNKMAEQAEVKAVNQLSVRALGCDPAAVKKVDGLTAVIGLARFYGKVQDVRYKANIDGGDPQTYFTGNFEGVNLQNSEVMRSGKLLLPKGISDAVEAAVKKVRDGDDKKASITFAYEIRSEKASNQLGYKYQAAQLKAPEAEDELASLRAAVAKHPLPAAPKPAAVPAKKAS